MTDYQKELINRVSEKFGNDEDVKELISSYRDRVDYNDDRDGFYAKEMESYLNSCSYNVEKFLEYFKFKAHRYLQNCFLRMIFKSISYMGDIEDNLTDGRNEAMVKKMRELKKICKDNNFYL